MSNSSPKLIRAHHFISSLTSEVSNIGFPNNTLRRWHKCSTASGNRNTAVLHWRPRARGTTWTFVATVGLVIMGMTSVTVGTVTMGMTTVTMGLVTMGMTTATVGMVTMGMTSVTAGMVVI